MKKNVILVGVLSLISSLALAQQAVTAPEPTSVPALGKAIAFPTFGVALAGPDTWEMLRGRDPEIIMQWTLINEQAQTMDGLIAATIEPTAGAKLEDFAKHEAQEMQMQIAPAKAQLGGQEALVLETTSQEKLFHPVRVLLVEHGGYFYQLVAYAAADQTHAGAVQAMAQGWKWIPIESPEQSVSTLEQPVSLFSGVLMMKAPAIARLYETPDSEHTAYLTVFDYQAIRPAFVIDVQRMARDAAVTAEEMQQDFARQLDGKRKGEKPLKWWKLNTPLKTYLSEAYVVTPAPKAPPKPAADAKAAPKDPKAPATPPAPVVPTLPPGKVMIINCLAFPDGQESIIINFTIVATEPAQQEIYRKLAQDIAATFTSKPVPPAPGKPAGK